MKKVLPTQSRSPVDTIMPPRRYCIQEQIVKIKCLITDNLLIERRGILVYHSFIHLFRDAWEAQVDVAICVFVIASRFLLLFDEE